MEKIRITREKHGKNQNYKGQTWKKSELQGTNIEKIRITRDEQGKNQNYKK